jgi:hypothetical protein
LATSATVPFSKATETLSYSIGPISQVAEAKNLNTFQLKWILKYLLRPQSRFDAGATQIQDERKKYNRINVPNNVVFPEEWECCNVLVTGHGVWIDNWIC